MSPTGDDLKLTQDESWLHARIAVNNNNDNNNNMIKTQFLTTLWSDTRRCRIRDSRHWFWNRCRDIGECHRIINHLAEMMTQLGLKQTKK
jgi:hypothetical protein